MRRYAVPLALVLALALAPAASGCARARESITVSRDALGTVVSVTAYGEDRPGLSRAVELAFSAMSGAERELDAHSASSTVAALNRHPYEQGMLPRGAVRTIEAVRDLGVAQEFSPALLGVLRLYDFEGEGRVPSQAELDTQLALARSFRIEDLGHDALRGWFSPLRLHPDPPPPGLDFGGAAKGIALDRAAEAMAGTADATLITAGSTTITFGSKPDGEPWRIGIEDPRAPGTVLATVEATGGITVSTSGDYQRFFERGGVRYHHIIDPRTGWPARGLRSLTVIGAASALDSDVLSTALFVMGPERAAAYCREHALGMYAVDDEGRTHVVPAPSNAAWRLIEQAQPRKS